MRTYKPITVSLTPVFEKKLNQLAKKLEVPRSVLVRKAILDLINTKPKKADFKKDF